MSLADAVQVPTRISLGCEALLMLADHVHTPEWVKEYAYHRRDDLGQTERLYGHIRVSILECMAERPDQLDGLFNQLHHDNILSTANNSLYHTVLSDVYQEIEAFARGSHEYFDQST